MVPPWLGPDRLMLCRGRVEADGAPGLLGHLPTPVLERLDGGPGPALVDLLRLRRHQVGRSGGALERALETRHHVAGEHLVALEQLLVRGPLVADPEQRPEPATRLLEAPDALD